MLSFKPSRFINSIQLYFLLASAVLLSACATSCPPKEIGPSQAARLALSEIASPKVMIVGDSISAGPGCYKKYLQQKLADNGAGYIQFVGEYSDDCGSDVMHSAVSCSTALDYTKDQFNLPYCKPEAKYLGLAPLMAKHQPDMVMVQLGVNDMWSGEMPVAEVLDRYQTLITQMRASNPDIVIAIAQIHKILSDNCTNQQSYDQVAKLVAALPAWAATHSRARSPIIVADLWTNSDPHDADDCVHPSDKGAQRMAENWYNALAPVFQ